FRSKRPSGLVGQAFPLAVAGRNACPTMASTSLGTTTFLDCQRGRGAAPCRDMGDQPMIKIESATQLAVFLSNRPGALARVSEELATAEINIHALSISDTADHSV